MEVINVHQRELDADPMQVGKLIDALASKEEQLWPKHIWPRMEFDHPLGVGATGGHGPIRYFVEEYTPGKAIRFRFTSPKGFNGFHCYQVMSGDDEPAILKHTLMMKISGYALLSWPLFYGPLHDALLEDSLTTAEAALGLPPQIKPWSRWVRVLRWIVSGGRGRTQHVARDVGQDVPQNEHA